jgi:hypothetical protein
MESLKLTDDVIALIHMIEGYRRSFEGAKERGESQEVITSFKFVIGQAQAELADFIIEAYRQEVPV